MLTNYLTYQQSYVSVISAALFTINYAKFFARIIYFLNININ